MFNFQINVLREYNRSIGLKLRFHADRPLLKYTQSRRFLHGLIFNTFNPRFGLHVITPLPHCPFSHLPIGFAHNLADEIILTRPPTARAADPAELLPVARQFARAAAVLDPAEALQFARAAARAEDTILVTGSLYTVAAVLRILRPMA